MFMFEIERPATTKAGLQKFIAENPRKEIIIIDEIDKMPIQHQEGLLTMMERGEFTTTKGRNTQTVKANMVIFATSNSTERLSKPLLSRFTVFEIMNIHMKSSKQYLSELLKNAPEHGNKDSFICMESK